MMTEKEREKIVDWVSNAIVSFLKWFAIGIAIASAFRVCGFAP